MTSCPVPDCENDTYHRGPCQSHHREFANVGMKWCTGPKCKQPLNPCAEFSRKSIGRDGLNSWCKPCVKSYQMENRDSTRVTDRLYIGARRSENPGFKHGIDASQYWSMWTAQEGRCAICSRAFDRAASNAEVDHDHAHCNGVFGCPECVRYLLCHACNSALGRAHDDPVILRRWQPTAKWPQVRIDAAIAYLEYWHAEMAKRGIRPLPEDSMWEDLFSTAARLVRELAP